MCIVNESKDIIPPTIEWAITYHVQINDKTIVCRVAYRNRLSDDTRHCNKTIAPNLGAYGRWLTSHYVIAQAKPYCGPVEMI